ncbi:MAG: hypothetical protein IKT08_04635 [Bacteroidales bacterium]|nr:hypothetical protein [Bacteroidales bacterium]
MKHTLVIFAVLLTTALAFLSFKNGSQTVNPENNNPEKETYSMMWKLFNEHLENSLPESAEEVLDSIEKDALKNHNQVQLLKTILYRRLVMKETVEDDSEEAYLNYALSKLDILDEVPRAVLHSEIAALFNRYLSWNRNNIDDNLAIDGDLSKVKMKYWDRQTFLDLVDQHYAAALQPVEALKATSTKEYLELFEDKYFSTWETYESTMFEFMFHRVAKHYQNTATADDIGPGVNTDDWWLDDKDFVKVNLGNSEKPLFKCLKIYQELIAYNLNRNAEACLYNNYHRYEYVNGILDDTERFQSALRTLMRNNTESKHFPKIANALAQSLVRQYEQNSSDSTYFDNYRKAYEICENTVKAFPKTSYDCKQTMEQIKDYRLSIRLNDVQLPNEPIPAILRYRNLEHPFYRIVKIKESELQTLDNRYGEQRRAYLESRETVASKVLDLPAETDFREHGTVIALPQLDEGIYYILLYKDKDVNEKSDVIIMCFQVSSLGFITDEKEKSLDIVTLDRKTGWPEPDVDIEIYRRVYNDKKREYEKRFVKTLKSDANGHAVLDQGLGVGGFNITLRKNSQVLLSNEDRYVPTGSSPSNSYTNTYFYTDRAIYRPGQTVYFKGVIIRTENGQKAVVSNSSESVSFRDNNWQEIAQTSFTSDEYGAFNGSFVIPNNLLNGVFHLNGKHGSTTIRVEEYKRPTFEINFERVKEQYKLNSDVTVHGSVDALAGFALDDVQYSYRVIRKTYFPWRCWWWWYPEVEDEQLANGSGHTDENGKFAVTFNLKPSLKTKPKQQPVFTYEIEVTATSAQGETHSDTYVIRAGYNEVAISTDLASLMEQSGLDKYKIYVENMQGEPAKTKVARKIYRLEDVPQINFFDAFRIRTDIDRQVLSDEEMKTLFPSYSFLTKTDLLRSKKLVYEDKIDVNDNVVCFPGKLSLKPGKYYIELKSLDDTLAITAQEFSIYQNNAKKPPYTTPVWIQKDKSTAHPDETVSFQIGTSLKDVKVWVQLLHGPEIRMEQWITLNNSVQEISYTVKEEDRDRIVLKTAFVKDNHYHLNTLSVSVPYDNLNLNVTLATKRDKLNPGSEETWTINIKDYKDNPVDASLLAGMYDASLDEFASQYWSLYLTPYSRGGGYFRADQTRCILSSFYPKYFNESGQIFDFSLPSGAEFFDLYRVDHLLFRKMGGMVLEERAMVESASIDMAASGKSVQNNSMDTMGAVEEESVEDESGEATQETTQTPEKEEPSVRENFNETAFFFPNLHPDEDGNCTFTFTLPDAITRWKLLMLAHNKDCQTGSNEYVFNATKPVMIMADMPRYLYDTDTLWFVANVINTGDEAVTPTAKLEVFDAATMKPLDLILSEEQLQMGTIAPGRSQKVRWKVAAQYDLSLIALRFTAYAGSFSDAEQHLLPVLSSEVFLTQTLPVTVKAETEQTFDFEAIANPDSHERDYSLTLNFSTNPVWYAVQSLPYLANVKVNRPENAFYAFYANTLSAYIAQNIPNLMAYIKRWQIETPDALMSQLEKDQDLKAILLQETPWVLEAKSETEQRSRIATLFEINNLKQQQHETLELLEKTQMYGGGWPWFPGMPESPFITAYILSGFGKLQSMGAWTFLNKNDQRKAERICEKAVKSLEYSVAESYRWMKRYKEEWHAGSGIVDELFALSFFDEQRSDKDFAKAKKYYLERLSNKKDWTALDFEDRAKAALLLYRSGDTKTAKKMIQSFMECAQKNDAIGIYWPKRYFSFSSHIATHALIMSAFAEIDQNQETLDQLKVWLLTQKQTNRWENSASTAEAIYALLMRGSDWLAEGGEVTLRFSEMPISTEGGVAGTGFIQRRWNANEVTDEMRHLTVNNPTGHLVWGGLFRQYFVPVDEVKSDESGFKIQRELFVETVTDKGKLLVPVGKQALKIGDKLTVKITIESQQDMSFVFVKDLRSAGFEPIEQISKYHYDDGMRYYQSNTDTDMEFFIDFLSKGVHQLQYSMFVTKEGNLSNGYALVQCQYAPEFSAYSDGMRVKVGQ